MKPKIVYANILGRTMVEAFLNKRPPCDCGEANACWHGPRNGHRQYMCDKCWKEKQVDL